MCHKSFTSTFIVGESVIKLYEISFPLCLTDTENEMVLLPRKKLSKMARKSNHCLEVTKMNGYSF